MNEAYNLFLKVLFSEYITLGIHGYLSLRIHVYLRFRAGHLEQRMNGIFRLIAGCESCDLIILFSHSKSMNV